MSRMDADITLIAGDEALADFRRGLTGQRGLELLADSDGRLLVPLAVGVGKSQWLLKIVEYALRADDRYDLVVVLVPRWDVLAELLAGMPAALDPVVLHPRPRKRCGELDADWQQYEQSGCGALGRRDLCGVCPHQSDCGWPNQYGKALQGVRLILATQQHVVNNAGFLRRLKRDTKSERPLLLIDESDLLFKSTERVVSREQLEQFAAAIESLGDADPARLRQSREWLYGIGLASTASTADLQSRWRFPWVESNWAARVQRAGRDLFGETFRFIAYDLQHFAMSDVASRERLPNGGLRFAVLPYFGADYIVFSGTVAPNVARYRLDPNHRRPSPCSPFGHIRFKHPGTRWYNINSVEGAARYFPGNAKAILDFFAGKIAQNIREGRRTLLVARKKFQKRCQTYLSERLEQLGVGPVTVVTRDWDNVDLSDPRMLPLITYGVCGLNRFEEFDAAYCLTGYYVGASTIADIVQDIDPTSDRCPISISISGSPPCRQAKIKLPDQRATILPEIVQGVFVQKEADVVVQAVGRVRPFTRPREVITFQVGSLPSVDYDLWFRTLAAARSHFRIPCRRQGDHAERVAEAQRLRGCGHTQTAIAKMMNLSLSSVKRYLRKLRGS